MLSLKRFCVTLTMNCLSIRGVCNTTMSDLVPSVLMAIACNGQHKQNKAQRKVIS